MTQEQMARPTMYCRKCGYALVGLSEDRCPECGRPFNPADRRTFFRHPHSYQRRRWIKRIALGLAAAVLSGTLLLAAWLGWIYWNYHAGWQAEQEAIAALRAAAGNPSSVFSAPWGIGSSPFYHLSNRLQYLRCRTGFVKVQGPTRSAVDLALLAVFKECAETRLTNLGLTDDHMKHLEGLTQLTQLGLPANPAITDSGLVYLKTLTMLTELDLSGTAVTGAGLRHLQALPRLRELSLANTQVRGVDLAALKGIPSLKRLVLGGPSITDADLVPLKALPLTYVTLSRTGITDAGLKEVGQMVGLELLDVSATAITDAGLPSLSGLTNVELLDLSNTAVTDAGLPSLSGLSKLGLLDLRNTAVTDAGLGHLRVLPRLRYLRLQGTKVTSQGIQQLQQAKPRLDFEGP